MLPRDADCAGLGVYRTVILWEGNAPYVCILHRAAMWSSVSTLHVCVDIHHLFSCVHWETLWLLSSYLLKLLFSSWYSLLALLFTFILRILNLSYPSPSPVVFFKIFSHIGIYLNIMFIQKEWWGNGYYHYFMIRCVFLEGSKLYTII